MEPYLKELHNITSELIGFAEDDFSNIECSSKECAIGNFIAEGYLNVVSNRFKINTLY